MKAMRTITLTSFVVVGLASFCHAQEAAMPVGIKSKIMHDAQIGSIICEDANGKRVLCSGSDEETVLGIATNIPYVTINKPSTPEGSRYIFPALVDESKGMIRKGDHLKAGAQGRLVRCEAGDAGIYAIALEDTDGKGTIQVKILRR
jgi:hypothetical protein